MKKIVYTLALLAFILNSRPTKAQEGESTIDLYYSMGLPTGGMQDYISKYSWRGAGLQTKNEVTDNIMLGLCFEWNVFYEEMNYGTYTRDNISISGEQFRYSNMFPMMGKIDYYKDLNNGVRVFAGTGIGTSYQIHDLDMSAYRFEINTWQFLLAPEVGLSYDIDADKSIFISAKYNINFKNDELDGMSYLNFNIGFCFR